jgi:hypothetical protein
MPILQYSGLKVNVFALPEIQTENGRMYDTQSILQIFVIFLHNLDIAHLTEV